MDKVFDKAWKLLAAPERWTQGAIAKSKNGMVCHARAKYAAKWCVFGAIRNVYDDWNPVLIRLEHVVNDSGFLAVGDWNDYPFRKHSEVVELLKKHDI